MLFAVRIEAEGCGGKFPKNLQKLVPLWAGVPGEAHRTTQKKTIVSEPCVPRAVDRRVDKRKKQTKTKKKFLVLV